jgi:hypothetical protein
MRASNSARTQTGRPSVHPRRRRRRRRQPLARRVSLVSSGSDSARNMCMSASLGDESFDAAATGARPSAPCVRITRRIAATSARTCGPVVHGKIGIRPHCRGPSFGYLRREDLGRAASAGASDRRPAFSNTAWTAAARRRTVARSPSGSSRKRRVNDELSGSDTIGVARAH